MAWNWACNIFEVCLYSNCLSTLTRMLGSWGWDLLSVLFIVVSSVTTGQYRVGNWTFVEWINMGRVWQQAVPRFWIGTLFFFFWVRTPRASLSPITGVQWVKESQLKDGEGVSSLCPCFSHLPVHFPGRGGPSALQDLPCWVQLWPLLRGPEGCFWIQLSKDTFGHKSPSWLK